MKRLITLCCVLLTLGVGARAQDPKAAPVKHGGRIETAYDGFAHETVISLKRMVVTCDDVRGLKGSFKGLCVSLRVSLHCPGQQLEYVRRATLALTFESKDWDARHPAGERQLSAVADGETLRLGPMTLAAQGVSESWLAEDSKETLELSIPYETFLKLARAGRVELSVGKTAFTLRDKNVAALLDMAGRVKPPQNQAGGGN